MADYHKRAIDTHSHAKDVIFRTLQNAFDLDFDFQSEVPFAIGGKSRSPDITMMHKKTNRKLFIEVKTKGKEGNAHERGYLWFCPGVLEAARKIGNWTYQNPKITAYQYIQRPFLIIFTGACLSVEKFRDEIKGHFGDCVENYILLDLQNSRFPHVIEDHIKRYFVNPLSLVS